MPRIARIAPNDYVYHVLCRGNDKKTVFKDDNDYEKYLEILQRYKERYKFSLYHYVLMGTHMLCLAKHNIYILLLSRQKVVENYQIL